MLQYQIKKKKSNEHLSYWKQDIKQSNYSKYTRSRHAGCLGYIIEAFEQMCSFQWCYVRYIDLFPSENYNCD